MIVKDSATVCGDAHVESDERDVIEGYEAVGIADDPDNAYRSAPTF